LVNLTTTNIHKSYGDFKALDNISIEVPAGSIFGLLGPNGAGKTTLIRIITQIIAPDQGSVLIDNRPLHTNDIEIIGYLPEERGLYKKMQVGEVLVYLGQLKGLRKAEVMERIKFWFKRFEIADWWGKKIEDLSKGMQQKIQFIATVLHQPKLLILDEPFSGFDPINATLIRDEIINMSKEGTTVILSTHRMESVEELCDHIVLIHKAKKVLEGSKKSIKNQYKTNTFEVLHLNHIGLLGHGFQKVQELTLEDGFYKSTIHMENGKNPNELLKELINQVEVHAFEELIPDMNQIFISAVKGGHNE
jgi:ABC-2 type transport system ATP-binding protein